MKPLSLSDLTPSAEGSALLPFPLGLVLTHGSRHSGSIQYAAQG